MYQFPESLANMGMTKDRFYIFYRDGASPQRE